MINSDSDSEDEIERPHKIVKISYHYKHKYNSQWEQSFTWIKKSNKGVHYFFYQACGVDRIGGLASVKKHDATAKHKKKLNTHHVQPPIKQVLERATTLDSKTKELELLISSFIVEHNISFNSVDHLTEIIHVAAKSPEAAKKVSLKRTKCTAIVKNVLGKTSFEALLAKIRTEPFSLMVDESTDHGGVKSLAMVVKIFDKNYCVKDEFLGLLPIADATANSLYRTVVDFFLTYQIPYKTNLIGFASDGANAMMGSKHSLKVLLVNDIPNLYFIKCVPHSLALCASYACLQLPRTPEDLVRDLHNYFHQSYKREIELKEFQEFAQCQPHKLLYASQTRWLSLLSVVRRVLEQFNALKLYFQSQYLNDHIQVSEAIYIKLSNPINKCYLLFLEFILPYLIDMNVEFQSESPKLPFLYNRIATIYKTMLRFYLKENYVNSVSIDKIQFENPNYFVPLENIYIGPKLSIEVVKDIFSTQEIEEFKKRCLRFYIECIRQINIRFPFTSDFIQSLKLLEFLDPSQIENFPSLGPLCNKFPNFVKDINELDKEWRLLKNSDIPKELNMIDFWRFVHDIKKGDNTEAYSNINFLVKNLLLLPHSSASVERIFSVINLNKTKVRNRLQPDTLSGIIHTKRLIDKECYSLKIDGSLLSNFKEDIYKNS